MFIQGKKNSLFLSLLGFKASQFLSKNSFYAFMSIVCMWQGTYLKGFCGAIYLVFLPLCEWKNYIVFSIEIVKWRKILEWRKILNIFHYDFKHHYDIVMQNIIILMAWLTCSKPLKFHVPSLQNITAAKLILISRWGVDWNSMFGQQLLYSILKIDVKVA